MDRHLIRSRSGGFTLVELLVAVTATAIVVAVVYGTFGVQQRVYGTEEQITEMQQGMRVAMEMIARDVRMAGFWGCPGDTAASFKNTLNTASLSFDPVSGFNNVTSNGAHPYNQAPTNSIFGAVGTANGVMPNTDIAGFTLADPDFWAPIVTQQTLPSADIKLQDTPDAQTLQVGDIAIVSDCVNTTIFQITNISFSGSQANVVHQTGGGAPGNATKCFMCDDRNTNSCTNAAECNSSPGYGPPGASLYKIESRFYWVGTNGQLNVSTGGSSGAGFTYTSRPIADNIEDLQFVYGEDTSAIPDGHPDVWVSADAVTDWLNVVAVEIHLLGKTSKIEKDYVNSHAYNFADRDDGPFGDFTYRDGHYRYYLARTVTLRTLLTE